jgi:membrane associated rhomboid family serine protease
MLLSVLRCRLGGRTGMDARLASVTRYSLGGRSGAQARGTAIQHSRNHRFAPRAGPAEDDQTSAALAAAAEARRLAAKYGVSPPAPPPPPPPARGRASPSAPAFDPSAASSAGTGTFALIAINVAVFLLARFTPLGTAIVSSLALVHSAPHAWQFVTCAFTHYDYSHLAGNLFSLLVFGRMVEEEEGALGVVLTYLVCGAAAAAASYFAMPAASVSLGASGSVFALFIVAVGAKLRPSLKKLTEAAVLGSFVFSQIQNEVKAQAAVLGGGGGVVAGGGVVSHVAHLGGALAGVLLLALLSRLPSAD